MLGFDRNKTTGKARVVTINPSLHTDTRTDFSGRSTSRYDVVLDVYPDGGEAPFRAETHHQFSPLRFPDPGEELAVKCNPDKGTVEIDLTDDARYNPKIFRKVNDRLREEEHDRVMDQAPGTSPDTGSSRRGDGSGRKFGDDGQLL